MLKRGREIAICVLQLFLFSLISMVVLLTLFHIALLGLPVIGFMWTFFWYQVFQAVTLIKIKMRHKVGTGALVMVYGYLAIMVLFLGEISKGSLAPIAAWVLVFLVCTVFTVLLIRGLIREYWPLIKEKVTGLIK